jgi:cysteine-rich repeat protein
MFRVTFILAAFLSASLLSTSAFAQVDCGADFLGELEAGVFTLCKLAEDDTTEFDFEVTAVPGDGGILVPDPVLKNRECIDVYTAASGSFPPDTVTISELVPEGWQVDGICVLNIERVGGTDVITSHEFLDGRDTIQGQIDAGKIGCVAIYSNSLEPVCGDGVVDPGEECDDGNMDDNDGCRNDCTIPREGCRFTGGLNSHFDTGEGENRYTAGGQAGANTALPPQPRGEWTHTNHTGPAGRFTFHGGTASAPEGTEIDEIRCSDPGGCSPSGNPPSPLKQLDFDGVGTFKNIGRGIAAPDFVRGGATVTAEGHGNRAFNGTFHWFEVNIDDLGEPGNSNPRGNPDDTDPALCPPLGFGEKGTQELANCGCSDFYRITIYDGVPAADVTKNADGSIDPSELNTTDVIYEVFGYIDGGNLQLHRPTGFDR